MMEKPGGRRHDAFTDYHQRIQMGDEVHGYEAEAVSAKHAFIIIYPVPLGTAHDCHVGKPPQKADELSTIQGTGLNTGISCWASSR